MSSELKEARRQIARASSANDVELQDWGVVKAQAYAAIASAAALERIAQALEDANDITTARRPQKIKEES